jgi:hypothetical protein
MMDLREALLKCGHIIAATQSCGGNAVLKCGSREIL